MTELSVWLENWRLVAEEAEKTPSEYHSITMTHAGTAYEVLLLSIYDPDIDEAESLLTTSRAFTNAVALYSRRTRDTGVGRIITNKGTPKYVLEQGREALLWGAAIEGVNLDRWMKAARQSHSWRGIERRVKKELKEKQLNLLREKAIENRLSELAEEKSSLEGLLISTKRKIGS